MRFWRLRKIIRDTTNPIPLKSAQKWNAILGRTYNISAFSSLCIVLYIYFQKQNKEIKEQGPLAETDAEYYIRTLGLKDIKVTRFGPSGKVLLNETVKDADEMKQKRMESSPGFARTTVVPDASHGAPGGG